MADLTFGEFRLDTLNKRLWRGEQPVDLIGTPFSVLCHLVERSVDTTHAESGQLLTKAELRQRVWGEVNVSEQTLRGCVSAIRKALGDDPQKPRYIETHHKQGWRFVMKVSESRSRPASSGRAPQPPNGPYDPGWYVERPHSEREIRTCLEYPGRPVVVYGPQGSGKRTLTSRILEAVCSQQPVDSSHVLRVSLRHLGEEALSSLDSMLRELGRLMLDPHEEGTAQAHELLSSIWTPGLDAKVNLKKLVRSQLLASAKTVYLVLSDVEGLASWRFQAAFFDMLRAWQDADALASLRLILESAIPPRLFPLGGHSPLWTKARRVQLKALDPDQIGQMAALYGLHPAQPTCMQLGELVGGLAGLCRHALYLAALRGVTLEAILKDYRPGQRSFGVFNEHLEDVQQWLELQPTVSVKLLREAARGVAMSNEEVWPLIRKGLLIETETRGVYTLRCKLYADFVAERAT